MATETICAYCGVGVVADEAHELFVEQPDGNPYVQRSSTGRFPLRGFKASLCTPCSTLKQFGQRSTLETVLGADFVGQFTDAALEQVGRSVRPLHEHDANYRAHGAREPWAHVNAASLKVDLLATLLPQEPPARVAHTSRRACGICGVSTALHWSDGPTLNGWPHCEPCDRDGCVAGPVSEWRRLQAVFPGQLTSSYWLENVIAPYRAVAAVDASMPVEGLPDRFQYLDDDDKQRLRVYLSNGYWRSVPAEWVKRWKRRDEAIVNAEAAKRVRFTAVGV